MLICNRFVKVVARRRYSPDGMKPNPGICVCCPDLMDRSPNVAGAGMHRSDRDTASGLRSLTPGPALMVCSIKRSFSYLNNEIRAFP